MSQIIVFRMLSKFNTETSINRNGLHNSLKYLVLSPCLRPCTALHTLYKPIISVCCRCKLTAHCPPNKYGPLRHEWTHPSSLYHKTSLTSQTRVKHRETAGRRARVSANIQQPKGTEWQKFLKEPHHKNELFQCLSKQLVKQSIISWPQRPTWCSATEQLMQLPILTVRETTLTHRRCSVCIMLLCRGTQKPI